MFLCQPSRVGFGRLRCWFTVNQLRHGIGWVSGEPSLCKGVKVSVHADLVYGGDEMRESAPAHGFISCGRFNAQRPFGEMRLGRTRRVERRCRATVRLACALALLQNGPVVPGGNSL